ncbi:hypothetical protein [Microbacterium caowuchunii]|uniref:Uncharacterized protein n=1 Tax=Microbacterium caowuchunii TaxID=2614638 RepID=A0A5N0T702_9MICO|nr:hypothetical protein [Microbacterium caowuchunii]KAA9130662.1 hypothetical protein F6B40_13605 [Microbacterium caowuchunii]
MSDVQAGTAGDDVPETTPRQAAWHRWFDLRFRTPVAVYGLIVYTSLINIAAEHGTVSDLLITSVASLIVFYLAHVFAHTLSDHGTHRLGPATASAFRHSLGMLYSGVPTTLAMVIASFTVHDPDELSDIATNTTFVMLFLLGLSAYTRTGAPVWLRLLGAIGTAMLGLLVVILELLLH